MPAQRPQAPFEPIPPDLDLGALVEQTPNFEYAPRIPCEMIEIQGMEAFEKLVLLHVVLGGRPLVVDGFQHKLDPWTFSTRWLRDNVGGKCMHGRIRDPICPRTDSEVVEQARVLNRGENMPLSISHYLEHMAMLTNQWSPTNYREKNRQRLYLKDIDCPELWHDKLREEIPASLFYLNESTGDIDGPGAMKEPNANGVGTKLGRGAAKAGDLMSCLPPNMRAENLMCYIGHEGTYTPAHREMCASLGQNIMVETSGLVGDDGKPNKPGSSIWFMTETKDRHLLSEYWLSSLGHDIEVEGHFAQINAWKRAPFNVYIVEQKVGDFILIPPLAPHQVWNRGTRTMKVAWNRTTVETLELAMNEALPSARMVCRDEQYKNKGIVLFTLNKYSSLLNVIDYHKQEATEAVKRELAASPKIRQLEKDFKRLFRIFTRIWVSEMFSEERPKEKSEYVPYDSNITCSYCRCNIFNRFLTCKSCVIRLEDGEEDTYDVCMECYAMGRSCKCRSRLSWAEQFPWKDLVEKYEIWRQQVVAIQEGQTDQGPYSIDWERKRWQQKTLAEICQEQLQIRPFKDVNKEDTPEPEEVEGQEGRQANGEPPRKVRKRRPDKWYRDNLVCHICLHRHPRWKMAACSCGTSFCYGSLWRGFDLKPQEIMQTKHWKCPRCRLNCSCNNCATNTKNKAFKPTGTVLGHDTRRFADPRSLEHLVDFSASNMYWVKKAGDDVPDGSERLLRKQDEAAFAKAQDATLDEQYVEDEHPSGSRATPLDAGLPLDPQLAADFGAGAGNGDVMQAAQNALSVMNGLSQLEQNPDAFIAQAGLASTDREGSLDYEYPDPNAGAHIPEESNHAEASESANKKRKKGRELPSVQSDAAVDVNTKFQLEQKKQSMEEAKRQGRLISAKAAITGHKKLVVLRLPARLLANFKEPEQPTVVPAEKPHEPVIVQSNLPKQVSPREAAARNPQVPRKRRRSEIDEDFTTTRTERRKAARRVAARKLVPEDGDQDAEDRSDSELDLEDEFLAAHEQEGAQKRRSLPAYLAQRSPVDETELPKELKNGSAPRASRPSKHQRQSLPTREVNGIAKTPTPRAGQALAPEPGLASMSEPHQATSSESDEAAAHSMPATKTAVLRPASAGNYLQAPDALQGFDDDSSSTDSDAESHIDGVPAAKRTAPVAKMASSAPIDANKKAKLRALGELSDSESEASDDLPILTLKKKAPPSEPLAGSIKPSKRPRGRPPRSAEKQNAVLPAPPPTSMPRKSILSKFGRRKVRISGR